MELCLRNAQVRPVERSDEEKEAEMRDSWRKFDWKYIIRGDELGVDVKPEHRLPAESWSLLLSLDLHLWRIFVLISFCLFPFCLSPIVAASSYKLRNCEFGHLVSLPFRVSSRQMCLWLVSCQINEMIFKVLKVLMCSWQLWGPVITKQSDESWIYFIAVSFSVFLFLSLFLSFSYAHWQGSALSFARGQNDLSVFPISHITHPVLQSADTMYSQYHQGVENTHK